MLEETSLEELWQLFPIFLVEHNPLWKVWYEEERNTILSTVPDNIIVRISHIITNFLSLLFLFLISQFTLLHLKEKMLQITV